MIYDYIEALCAYGVNKGLIEEDDKTYIRNRLLDVMGDESFAEASSPQSELPEILRALTDIAVKKGLCADTAQSREIFDTRVMNILTPFPREVTAVFRKKYDSSPQNATDWFYKFSGDTNYIRRDRIALDRRWKYSCEYGEIDITINLSKPEKDPRDIAAALCSKEAPYPMCQLCAENVGYSGRIGHPARANHRIIPITLCDEKWFFQYSPYVYYNEHCIVLNSSHKPMKISEKTFSRLFDFVSQFPHYFIGSNADLPIVGGSILTHDHFQGGRYTFAMERAPIEHSFKVAGYDDIDCGIIKWPLSVIRLCGKDTDRLTSLACIILNSWRNYTDKQAMIFAETDGTPHNTITPIARKRGDSFELDLCLRNNLTTSEHPLGLYHPHEQRHHIKKENIGLIEVMGLAVLPSRLQRELDALEELIISGKDPATEPLTEKHAEWAKSFYSEISGQPREAVRDRLQQEVGKVFLEVLKDAGVFKRNTEGKEHFLRFIDCITKAAR